MHARVTQLPATRQRVTPTFELTISVWSSTSAWPLESGSLAELYQLSKIRGFNAGCAFQPFTPSCAKKRGVFHLGSIKEPGTKRSRRKGEHCDATVIPHENRSTNSDYGPRLPSPTSNVSSMLLCSRWLENQGQIRGSHYEALCCRFSVFSLSLGAPPLSPLPRGSLLLQSRSQVRRQPFHGVERPRTVC